MSEIHIKCPSCLSIGVVLNFSGQNILECDACKYRITKDELLASVSGQNITTCPPNCNGECGEAEL